MIEVVQHGDEYVMEFPGVPAPYAPRLRRAGEPNGPLLIVGGPYDGLSVSTVHRDGVDRLLIGDALTLPRWRESADAPAGATVIRGLPAWPDPPDAGTLRRYETLLAEVLGSGGGVVRPPAAVALGSWARWLSDREAVLFHGSDNGGLDVLYPRRTSYEVDDQAQRGNRCAMDGCTCWPATRFTDCRSCPVARRRTSGAARRRWWHWRVCRYARRTSRSTTASAATTTGTCSGSAN